MEKVNCQEMLKKVAMVEFRHTMVMPKKSFVELFVREAAKMLRVVGRTGAMNEKEVVDYVIKYIAGEIEHEAKVQAAKSKVKIVPKKKGVSKDWVNPLDLFWNEVESYKIIETVSPEDKNTFITQIVKK